MVGQWLLRLNSWGKWVDCGLFIAEEIKLASNSIEMVADDLVFPEWPRWRSGGRKLYFSDVRAGKVSRGDD